MIAGVMQARLQHLISPPAASARRKSAPYHTTLAVNPSNVLALQNGAH
jgi:hypothetical protein